MRNSFYPALTLLLLLATLFNGSQLMASHVKGGDFNYEYLERDTVNGSPGANYKFRIVFYRDCSPGAINLPNNIRVGVYSRESSASGNFLVPRVGSPEDLEDYAPGCPYPPSICIEEHVYERDIFLPDNDSGYTASVRVYARNESINNLESPQQCTGCNLQGMLLDVTIPANHFENSSPAFLNRPVPFFCNNTMNTFNHNAFDSDGDSLVFRLAHPYSGARATGNGVPGGRPPYTLVEFLSPFTFRDALGRQRLMPTNPVFNGVLIDRNTGEVRVRPTQQGLFVITVEVDEYRVDPITQTTTYMGSVRRDIQFVVGSCGSTVTPSYASNQQTEFTVSAGDSLCFDIEASDPGGNDLFFRRSGPIFGGGNVPPPFATLVDSFQTDSILSVEFCWETTCNSARTEPYLVTTSITNDQCNTANETFSITVVPRVLVPPPSSLNCLDRIDQNTLSIDFTPPNDFKDFGQYYLYRSTNGGNFNLIDSITDTTATSWVDDNANNNDENYYAYFIRSVNDCGVQGLFSDTIGSIALTVDSINARNAALEWNAPYQSFNGTFELYYDDGSGFSFFDTTRQTTYPFNSCDFAGDFEVRATRINPNADTCTISSNKSFLELLDTIPPNAPEMQLISVENDRVEIQFVESSSNLDIAGFYYIERAQDTSGSFSLIDSVEVLTDSIYTFEDSVDLSQSYCYRVYVLDSCGNQSDFSATFCQNVLTANADQLQVNLNWTNVVGFDADVNLIERFIDGNWALLDSLDPSGNNFSDTLNLFCNRSEQYRIHSLNRGNSFSSFSNLSFAAPFDTTAPDAPNIQVASVNSGQSVEVVFDTSQTLNVDRFEVFASADGSNFRSLGIQNLSIENPNIFNTAPLATADSQYCFFVRAIDSCSDVASLPSDTHCLILPEATNANLAAIIDWSDYQGFDVEQYVIQKWDNGSWANLDSVDANTNQYIDSIGLLCNNPYFYRIQARENGGNQQISTSDSVLTIPFDSIPPAQVDIVNSSIDNNGTVVLNFLTLTKNTVDRYEIMVSENGGAYSLLHTLIPDSAGLQTYLHENINTGTTQYCYQVFAVDSCSDLRSLTSETHCPVLLTGKEGNRQNELVWTNYKGYSVQDYEVEIWESGQWVSLTTTTDTAFRHDSLDCNVPQHYRIKTNQQSGSEVSFSDSITLTPFDTVPPAAPGIHYASVDGSDTSVYFSWDSDGKKDIVRYIIYRKSFTASEFEAIDTISANFESYRDTSIRTTFDHYCYAVAAVDSCNENQSELSDEHCIIIIESSVSDCRQEIDLNWTTYVGFDVDEYELLRSVDGGALQPIAQLSAQDTVFKDTNSISYLNTYCYLVTAKGVGLDADSLSFSSGTCNQTFEPEQPVISKVSKRTTSSSAGQIVVKWTAIPNSPHLSHYRLYVATDTNSGFQVLQDQIDLTTDSFLHTGLDTRNQDYFYYLSSFDSCGNESQPSIIHKSITLTTIVGQLVHDLNWTPYQGWPVAAYLIENKIGGRFEAVDTVDGNTTSYIKSPAPCNNEITYRVSAVDSQGVVAFSDTTVRIAIDTIPPDAAHFELLTVTENNQIDIDYIGADSSDIFGFEIERLDSNGQFQAIHFDVFTAPSTPFSYSDTNFDRSVANTYRIVTLDSCLNATVSDTFSSIHLSGRAQNLANEFEWNFFELFNVGAYVVEVLDENNDWEILDTLAPNVNEYTHDSLVCNLPFTYKVRALADGDNRVSTSTYITLTPFDSIAPAAPEIDFVSVLDHNRLEVQWQLSEGKVDRYELQLRTNGGSWNTLDTVGVDSFYVFENLNTDINEYCVQIVAIDSCANNRSTPSTPHCPVKISGEGQNLQNALSWTPYEGFNVAGYLVQNFQNGQWVNLDSLPDNITQTLHQNLPCNIPEVYRIVALDDQGLFATLSDSIILTPFDSIPPAAPEIDFVSVLDHNRLEVQWQLSEGKVDRYELQLRTNVGSWNTLDTVGVDSFYVFENLNTNQNGYCVQIVAIDSCANNRSTPSTPHCPVKISGEGQNLQNALSWTPYEGFNVAGYFVQNYQNDQWVNLDSLDATESNFTHEDLPCNIPEAYRIVALDDQGLFATLSDSIILTPFDTIPPSKPNMLYASVEESGVVSLLWETSSSGDAKFYEVWGQAHADSAFRLLNTNVYDTTFNFTADTRNDAWQFYIIAIDSCDADNRSIPSDTHQIMIPEVPETGDCFPKAALSWSPYRFFDGQNYTVERTLKGLEDYQNIHTTTDTFYLDTMVVDENMYCYRFKASDDDWLSYSDTVCVRPFTFPMSDSATLSAASILTTHENNGRVEVRWNLADVTDIYLQAYELFHRSEGSANFNAIAYFEDTLQNSFIHSGVNTQDLRHQYFLQTINVCDVRNEMVDTHFTVKMEVQPLNLGAAIEWTAYEGFRPERYEVQRLLNDGDYRTIGNRSHSEDLSWVDSSLRCDQLYAYRIVAFDENDNANFVYSDTFAFTAFDTIPPTEPELRQVSVNDDHALEIDWDDIPDANRKGFYIYRKSAENAPPQLIDSLNNDDVVGGSFSFLDDGVNPAAQPYRYVVASFDSCGNISEFSPVHASIHLNVTAESELNTIVWTPYIGWDSEWTYSVERKEIGGNWETLVDGLSNLQYLDEYPGCDVEHIYRIRAVHQDGRFVFSNRDTVTSFDDTPPENVKLQSLIVTEPLDDPNKNIELEWGTPEDPDVVGIELFQNQRFDIRYRFIDSFETTENTHLITYDTINFDFIYCYAVTVKDNCNNVSPISNKACIMELDGSAESGSNEITWNEYEEWEAGVAAYEVFRSDDGENFISLGTVTETSFTDEDLTDHIRDFCYYVEAIHPTEDYRSRSIVHCLRQPALVYIPNAFTPGNGDELNDFFEPGGMFIDRYDMKIFDRWGALIFETEDAPIGRDNFGQGAESSGWDGHYNGRRVPEGVYIYKMTIWGVDGERIERDGNITIVY